MSNLHIAELQAIAKGLRAKLQKHGLHHYSATTVKTLVVRDSDHFENAADISHILYAFEQLCDNGNAELQEIVAAQAEVERVSTEALLQAHSKIDDLKAENKRLLDAMVRQQHEIQQILGKALGYPPFPPEFDAEGQVAVGDHIAETLAMEAAERLASVTARLAAAEEALSHARSFVYQQDDGEVVRISAKGTFSTVKTWMIWHSKRDWLPNSQHDTLDAAIAAAVSAGWMNPLGDNTKETT